MGLGIVAQWQIAIIVIVFLLHLDADLSVVNQHERHSSPWGLQDAHALSNAANYPLCIN